MNKLSKISLNLSTMGMIGYLPAPGTMATFVTLFIVYLINFFKVNLFGYFIFLIFITIVSFWAIKKSLFYFKNQDPAQIVLDEFLGCLIAFFAIPVTGTSLIIGMILFRFFDIIKPLGISKLEKYKGAWGIIMDDVAAGIFSNVILQIIKAYV